jgi:hypothetical protein
LAASAAPSTQHTPSGEFSVLGDFEEDRKPNIEYLDSLNEHNKRSRSVEHEADDAERKQAKVSDAGAGGWGLGRQVEENGERQEHLPMNGVESLGLNVQHVTLADEDPTVYGPLLSSLFLPMLCSTSLRFQWMENQCRSRKLERSTTT